MGGDETVSIVDKRYIFQTSVIDGESDGLILSLFLQTDIITNTTENPLRSFPIMDQI